MQNTFDFPAFVFNRLDDNILHIEMKKVKKLTAEDVAQIFECFKNYDGDEGVFHVVTFNGYIPLSDEAMAESKKAEYQKYINTTAYVIKSAALRIGINFFINFYKPKGSINIFGTKSEALSWLKKMKKEQLEKEFV